MLVLCSLLAPALRPLYERVARRLGEVLEAEVGFVEGYRDFDLGFVCSPVFLRDPDLLALAAPVPAGERSGGRPIHFSDVIVRADHPARTFADLRGARWGFNETASYSGFGALVWHVHRGYNGQAFFGSLVKVGSHAEAIARVLEGDLEAAAIDSQVLAVVRRDDPELQQRLRVVEAIGPAPTQPLVARRQVPEGIRRDVAVAVVGLHDDPASRAALAAAGVERFVAVDRAAYADIESRLAVIDAASAAVS